ncbi:MAG: hypothetical protein Q4C95_09085 [Planctomycetia bacterium]|nr:hypothetical protein [Planctomycetia bacterium]
MKKAVNESDRKKLLRYLCGTLQNDERLQLEDRLNNEPFLQNALLIVQEEFQDFLERFFADRNTQTVSSEKKDILLNENKNRFVSKKGRSALIPKQISWGNQQHSSLIPKRISTNANRLSKEQRSFDLNSANSFSAMSKARSFWQTEKIPHFDEKKSEIQNELLSKDDSQQNSTDNLGNLINSDILNNLDNNLGKLDNSLDNLSNSDNIEEQLTETLSDSFETTTHRIDLPEPVSSTSVFAQTDSIEDYYLSLVLGRAITPQDREEYYWEDYTETEPLAKKQSLTGYLTFPIEFIGCSALWITRVVKNKLQNPSSQIDRKEEMNRPLVKKRHGKLSDMAISIAAGILIASVIVFPTLKLIGHEFMKVIVKSTVRKIGQNVILTSDQDSLDLIPLISDKFLFPQYQTGEVNENIQKKKEYASPVIKIDHGTKNETLDPATNNDLILDEDNIPFLSNFLQNDSNEIK